MSTTTRSGRAKPAGGGWELAVWYLIRLSGLGLFVLALAHYTITHFVFDVTGIDRILMLEQADVLARWHRLRGDEETLS